MRAQRLAERLGRVAVGRQPNPDGGGHRVGGEGAVAQRREAHQPRTVAPRRQQAGSHLKGRTGFPDPADARYRHQTRSTDQPLQLRHLAPATDERGEAGRQVGRRLGRGIGGRAVLPGGRFELFSGRLGQRERARQQRDRLAVRRLPGAPLERADADGAQAGKLGQLFLREARSLPVPPQEGPEGRTFAGSHCTAMAPLTVQVIV